jgi:hypothetical protein
MNGYGLRRQNAATRALFGQGPNLSRHAAPRARVVAFHLPLHSKSPVRHPVSLRVTKIDFAGTP